MDSDSKKIKSSRTCKWPFVGSNLRQEQERDGTRQRLLVGVRSGKEKGPGPAVPGVGMRVP